MSEDKENSENTNAGGGVAALAARFNKVDMQGGVPSGNQPGSKPPVARKPPVAGKPLVANKPKTPGKPPLKPGGDQEKRVSVIAKQGQSSVGISELQEFFAKKNSTKKDEDESPQPKSPSLPKEVAEKPPLLAPKKFTSVENKENKPTPVKSKGLGKAPVALPPKTPSSLPAHGLPETVILPSGKKLRLCTLPENSGPPPPVPDRPPGMVLPGLDNIPPQDKDTEDEEGELYDDVITSDDTANGVRPTSLIPEMTSDEENVEKDDDNENDDGEDEEIYDEVECPAPGSANQEKEDTGSEEEYEELYEELDEAIAANINSKELKKMEKAKKKKVPTATLR